jgi:hypothetical protein
MNHRRNSAEFEAGKLVANGGVVTRGPTQLPHSANCAIASAARARLIRAATRRRRSTRHTDAPYYGIGAHIEEAIDGVLGTDFDALVTRNHYGCLVLNAAHALFIDVDLFVPNEIYNPIEYREERLRPVRQQVLSDVRAVLEKQDEYGFRIYRTAGGFRILATTHEFEPGSRQAEGLMGSVGADSDFVELCKQQRNFRARLTPKPWRCGLRRPPNLFPRKTAAAEERFQNWLTQYVQACGSRATCQLVGQVGPDNVHERIRPVVEFHDRETSALSGLPLA